MRSVFFGSDQSTFQVLKQYPHPFDPCPGSPNCIIHSKIFSLPDHQLFERCMHVLKDMTIHKLFLEKSDFYIHAIFRIPLFGFKDDLYITVTEAANNCAVLHIKSASRLGRSDFGVNARRIHFFVDNLN